LEKVYLENELRTEFNFEERKAEGGPLAIVGSSGDSCPGSEIRTRDRTILAAGPLYSASRFAGVPLTPSLNPPPSGVTGNALVRVNRLLSLRPQAGRTMRANRRIEYRRRREAAAPMSARRRWLRGIRGGVRRVCPFACLLFRLISQLASCAYNPSPVPASSFKADR